MKRSLRKIISVITAAAVLLTSGFIVSRTTTAEAEHTVLQQWDPEWGSYPYGDGTLQNSGCGAFAILNAVRYLTGYTMDIYELADWASANEYIWGVGSAFTIAPHAAERYGSTYGFQTDTHYFFSDYTGGYYPASNEAYQTIWNMLVTKLSAGQVAVGLVHNHFIAIVDYDPSTQKVLVYDPGAGSSRGTTVYGDWKSYDDLNYWSNSGSSYLKLRAYLTFYFNTGTASGTPVFTTASTDFNGSEDTFGTYTVSTDGSALNLRTYASTSSEIITQIPSGAKVQVIESDGSWAMITYNGISGYCSFDYLTPFYESTDTSVTTTTTTSTETTITTTADILSAEFAGEYVVSAGGSYLNMRSGTSTSESIVTQIPDKTPVTVTAANDEWAAVTWNGLSGYCSMAYLKKAEETQPYETTETTTETTTVTTFTAEEITSAETSETTAETFPFFEETESSSETTTTTEAILTETTTSSETAVSEDLTSESEENPEYSVYSVDTNGVHLNLRASASMNGDILAQIPNGSKVLAAYYDGDWMRVTWNDIEGFCKVDYLSRSIASILEGSSMIDHTYKTTYGDVNIDNQITMADVVSLHKSLSGAISLNMTSAANADCYMDGQITLADAAVIIQFILQNNTLPMKPIR
ncbi:MAG: SH3 domain-containing protein [Ruminococcus sp.]|nr:SH3 domain-containing protein [Ruminococcus sp.]